MFLFFNKVVVKIIFHQIIMDVDLSVENGLLVEMINKLLVEILPINSVDVVEVPSFFSSTK
jgi:hypothetical protein